MIRIGIDTGGTFTDFVVAHPSGVQIFKIPSTPNNPAESMRKGLLDIPGPKNIIHGTTVATNAILERRGAKTAFIVNEGFKDLLFIGRQTRPDIYALEPVLPPVPISREDCFVVTGRIGPSGIELQPCGAHALSEIKLRYQSAAVCLLFSYANPMHESQVKDVLQMKHVSLSHQVSPEFREYERGCVTLLNAYIAPVIEAYFSEIERAFPADQISIMTSGGGIMPIRSAIEKPILSVTSGPAAGAAAAAHLAKTHNKTKAIAFDVGGTSTDVTLIEGDPLYTNLSDIGGLPCRLRRVDVHTIGCGGGSIAELDEAGALKVGPKSVGADPGPAFYGVGSTPCIADAHVVLGRLALDLYSGGLAGRLIPERSFHAIGGLASRLGASAEQTANAIIELAVAQMARAIRKISSERGRDPEEYCLVAYGGGGGLHACEVADELRIREILIPQFPGVFSAYGLLLAPIVQEASATVIETHTPESWHQVYEGLIQKVKAEMACPPDRIVTFADMRYKGQGYELTVCADDGFERTCEGFEREHQAVYGARHARADIQWVAARVRAERDPEPLPPAQQPSFSEPSGSAIIQRHAIPQGGIVQGPLLIVQSDSTTYLPKHWESERLSDGTLVLRKVL